jgi:O-antigen ligase
MTVLLPTVAALVSLLILPGWSFWFDVTPKVVVALLGAALACILFRDWPAFRGSPVNDSRVKWFGILAAFQAVTLLLGTAFSTHPQLSLLGSTWRRSGLLPELAVLLLGVAAAAHFAMDRTRVRLFLRGTALAAIPASIYGIAQYFGFDPWIPASGYHVGEGAFMIVRPPSTLGHAAYFATYLLYATFAGVALALSEADRRWKALAIGISGLASFTLVLTGTRAALAGLFAGILWLAVRQRLNRSWLVGAAAMLVLIGGFYVAPAGERLRARVHWSSEDPLGGGRLLLWRDTLGMARARWFSGYGNETFALEFPRYQSFELGRGYPDFYQESPHNIFLDALASRGVLGLLAMMALAGLGIKLARGPIGAAFVAILVSQQFSSFTLPTELYFYFCLALLVSDRSLTVAVRNPVVAIRSAWAIAALFVCFALYLATGDALLASARHALDRGDVDTVARQLDRARRWNANADIYFSRRLLALPGAWPYGLAAAQRATVTADDRQNALVNLAAFYAAENNPAAVELCLRQAIAIAPNWFKPHWLLAQVLALEGRKQEAEAEALAAVARDGGKHPEVAQVMDHLRGR